MKSHNILCFLWFTILFEINICYTDKYVKITIFEKIFDLFMIPIDKLVSFQRKGERDFSVWNQDKLNDMANKMDTDGAYNLIIVRQIDNDKYLTTAIKPSESRFKGQYEFKVIEYVKDKKTHYKAN